MEAVTLVSMVLERGRNSVNKLEEKAQNNINTIPDKSNLLSTKTRNSYGYKG